jgi:phage baseplate assembly protein W
LGDGRIVVIGGTLEDGAHSWDYNYIVNGTFQEVYVNTTGAPANRIEIYDPTAGTWSEVATTTHARWRPRATLLPNGKIFIYQGLTGESPELFDPATNTVTTVASSPLGLRQEHVQTLLDDGKLLVAGGADYTYALFVQYSDFWTTHPVETYLYDPTAGTFAAGPLLSYGRAGAGAVPLTGGSALIAGGALTVAIAGPDSPNGGTAAAEFLALAEVVVPPPVPPPPSAPATDVVYSGPRITHYHPLGAGLIRPFFRTEHGDFASFQGPDLVSSNIGQVLGTGKGTLPWRTELGSDLERLRHGANTADFRELTEVFVRDAIARWEPRAQLTQLRVDPITDPEEVNQITLRAKVNINGSEGEQRLRVDLRRLAERTAADGTRAWAADRSRLPRGMSSIVPRTEPVVQRLKEELGGGLIRPFRRVGSDFNAGFGVAVIRANIGEVFGIVPGTLPWRPELGSELHRLLHQRNTPGVRELARLYVEQALSRWEPRSRLTGIELLEKVGADDNEMVLRIACALGLVSEPVRETIDLSLK